MPAFLRRWAVILSLSSSAAGVAQQNDTWKDSWRDFGWIFVGGYHFSGTSVASKLVSAQPWAAGLSAESKLRETLTGCAKSKCKAPENEGVFLTSAFKRLNAERRCTRARWGDSGECARETFETAKRLMANAPQMRQQAWTEWRRFIRANDRKYRIGGGGEDDDDDKCPTHIVEKDIDNLYRAPLLEAMFGKERVSFVFTLRHPLARREEELELADVWLQAHRIVLDEVAVSLERIFVFQNERLRSDPDIVLEQLANMLRVDPFIFQRGSRKLFFHADTVAKDTGYIIIEPPKSLKEFAWNNSTQRQRNRLIALDSHLARFCYSIHHTNPLVHEHDHCRSPVLYLRHLRNSTPSPLNKTTRRRCDWPGALSLQSSPKRQQFSVQRKKQKRGVIPAVRPSFKELPISKHNDHNEDVGSSREIPPLMLTPSLATSLLNSSLFKEEHHLHHHQHRHSLRRDNQSAILIKIERASPQAEKR